MTATGRLAGIARHAFPKAPMETVAQAAVTLEGGIAGDYRGGIKRRPHKRQVTLIERADWDGAMAALGADVLWAERRANLLVEGVDLPQQPGARIVIGEVVLEVTIECDPCSRMEAVTPGLKDALTPDWRGGVCTQVITGGEIAVGDEIRIEQSCPSPSERSTISVTSPASGFSSARI